MGTKHETSDLFGQRNRRAAMASEIPQGARLVYVCAHCGSAEVFGDAAVRVRWDVDAQRWTLTDDADCEPYDNTDCGHCNGETRAIALPWDDADVLETFMRRAHATLTEPRDRTIAFEDWLKLEAVVCEDDDDTSPRQKIAARLIQLRNPESVSWEFVRSEKGPTAATYYCAAIPQDMSLDQARKIARNLGPHVAAIRDDDGDWVFGMPLDVVTFSVDRAEVTK